MATARGASFDVPTKPLYDMVVAAGFDRIDAMKVDIEGNVYCTGPGGIWIFDSAGTHLGTIATGAQTTNVAWGDADWRTLYFTTWQTLCRIRMNIPGIPVPRGPVAAA